MTVLVTGAGGFVGSQVVRQLIAANVEVVATVRPAANHPRLAGLDGTVQIVEADLADSDSVARMLSSIKPEACIHAAWYAVPGKYLSGTENLESLSSSLKLLELLAEAGCRHIVGVGSCFEYRIGHETLTEDSPTGPSNLYAASKLAFMLVGAQRARQLDMVMAWARLFYLYGPFEDSRRLMPQAIKALRNNVEFSTTPGHQVRDWLHVEDVASGLCAVSHHRLSGAFNVCSGEAVTIAGLMQTLGELLGRPELIRLGAYPPRDWDPAYVCGDSTRLRTEAHWSPRYTLRDGLAQTINWWDDQR